jgi:hypothetical protein
MKTKKALLAEKLTLEQAIQALQTKAHSSTRTDHTDGSFAVSVPITATDMKQMAVLRVKLDQADSLLGQRKSSTRKTTSTLGIKDPNLLTEQMLAERWYCSTSRLQRWRAANTGPTYLKIGGKVLYRQEDVSAYETVHLVKTEPKT